MAKTITTEVTVTTTGDGVDSAWTPTAMTNSAGAAGGPVRVTLASGDNYIVVPTGAMGFLLVPPATSGVTKRLKHHSGETGIEIRTGQQAMLPLATGVATMMIHASAIENVDIHWT